MIAGFLMVIDAFADGVTEDACEIATALLGAAVVVTGAVAEGVIEREMGSADGVADVLTVEPRPLATAVGLSWV